MPHRSTHPSDSSDPVVSLKSQYAQELKTLKDLFSEWSEVDLLSTLEETNGDVELAISRIAEGQAEQWGQVKPVKKKKEKENAAPDDVPSVRGGSSSRGRGGFSGGRGGSRGGFSGRGASTRGRGRGSRGGGRGGLVSHEDRTRSQLSEAIEGPDNSASTTSTWGESVPQIPDWTEPTIPETQNSVDWNANGKDWRASGLPAKNQPQQKKNRTKAKTSSTNIVAKSAFESTSSKGTWAQLVKGPDPPKPETKSVSDVPAKSTKSPSNEKQSKRGQSPVKNNTSAPVSNSLNEIPISPRKTDMSPVRSPQAVTSEVAMFSPTKPNKQSDTFTHAAVVDSSNSSPPGLKQTRNFAAKSQPSRKLNQDAAVVMPQNASMSSIGVRFGTLNIGGTGQEDDSQHSSAPTAGTAQSKASGTLPNQQIPGQNATNPLPQNPPTLKGSDQLSNMNSVDARTQVHGTAHPQMPPVPLQHMAAASGFGFGNVATLPAEYQAMYSTAEAQRALMGYYADPSAYSQLAAAAALNGKYPVQDVQTNGSMPASSQQLMQQQQNSNSSQQQQPTAANAQQYAMQYYYPYYLPNQFQNAYQSSVYQQQFVNKSMYPYPEPTPVTTGSNVSAAKMGTAGNVGGNTGYYGAGSNPGQPQMYHQYDDVSSVSSGDYKNMNATQGAYGISTPGFQSFGLGQGSQKAGVSPQTGGDYKPQQSRPNQQRYDGHKYPQNPMTTAQAQSQIAAGNVPNSGNSAAQASASYYNQHQMSGMHQPNAQHHVPLMQHGYQSGLYNRGQQQHYWNGQN